MKKIVLICIFIFIQLGFIASNLAIKELIYKNNIDLTKDMVLVPAGEFTMGSIKGFENEFPVHKVWVDSFYIDKYLVSNEKYKKFCDSTKRIYPPNPIWDTSYFIKRPNYPVINVDWEDARAYSEWAGKRLPTEAEWEKAAKGGRDVMFFCGDSIDYNKANYNGVKAKDKWRHTSPIDSFDPNEYGIYDMGGNVWQWCFDYYMNSYYFIGYNSNPMGPLNGTEKVVRGGSWDSDKEYLRVSVRGKNPVKTKNSNVGFRCTLSIQKSVIK